MALDASWSLQQAIFTALTGATAVQTYLGNPARVYDRIPRGEATFPYLVIGETTVADAGAKAGANIDHHSMTMHVWSRYDGKKEAKQILDAIRDTLHHQTGLSVSGHTLVELTHEFTEIFGEDNPDGVTWHGVTRYGAITQAN